MEKRKIYIIRLEESWGDVYNSAETCFVLAEIPFIKNRFHNAFIFTTNETAQTAYDILLKEDFLPCPIEETSEFSSASDEILYKFKKGFELDNTELEELIFGQEDLEILRTSIDKTKTKHIYKSIIEIDKTRLSIRWFIDKWGDRHFPLQPVEVENYSLTINEKHYFRVPDYINEQER